MVHYLFFRNKRYRRLQLNISPKAEFGVILKILNEVSFPGCSVKQEHIVYSILELVNNSIRAHREHRIEENILIRFEAKEGKLHVQVKDFGGGFDLSKLPYDLSSPIEKVDLNGDSFAEYRVKHHYQRFGMGLYITRKAFTEFSISFFDGEGRTMPYKAGKTRGTCIDLALGETA